MNSINSLKILVEKSSLLSITPELCILVAMLLALVFSLFKNLSSKAWLIISPLLIVGLTFCIKLFFQLEPIDSLYSFQGSFLIDKFALLLKGLIFMTLLSLSLSLGLNELTKKAEFIFLLLGASLGACFLISANDLILIFISLETLSLSSIALISYCKNESLSGEAGIKYLLNSAVASAFLLFAFSLIYGIMIGSTNLSTLPTLLNSQSQFLGTLFPFIIFVLALLMIIVAVGFKLSLAPFHLWAPDVYNGANLPSTAFLATISKIAAFGLFCRLGWTLFSAHLDTYSIVFKTWNTIFALLAIASMLVGNIVGARQIFRQNGSIKRLMAYSSIAQIGYIMTASVLGSDLALSQGLFYLIMYIIVTIGAFIGLFRFESWFKSNNIKDLQADDLNALKGLYKIKPLLSIFLGICFANLAAVFPSMLIAKFILIEASLKGGFLAFLPKGLIEGIGLQQSLMVLPQISLLMAITILVSSVISLFYYFSLIKMIFVDEPNPELLNKESNPFQAIPNWTSSICLLVLFISTILLSIYSQTWIIDITSQSAQSMVNSANNDLNTVLLSKKNL